MWFITLVLLAIAASFIVLIAKSKGDSRRARTDNQDAPTAPDNPTGTSAGADAGMLADPVARTAAKPGTNPGASPASHPVVDRAPSVTRSAQSGSGDMAGVDGTAVFVHRSGDTLTDIQEMIKILNLRATDAQRLGITEQEFESLAAGQAGGLDAARLQDVHRHLERLLT